MKVSGDGSPLPISVQDIQCKVEMCKPGLCESTYLDMVFFFEFE